MKTVGTRPRSWFLVPLLSLSCLLLSLLLPLPRVKSQSGEQVLKPETPKLAGQSQQEADAKAAAEAAAAEEKRLEECRRRACVNYRVEKPLAAGDPITALFEVLNRPSRTFEQALTPDDGSWPPGYDVNDYRTIAVASAAAPAEGVAETALGRMLRQNGVDF